VSTILFLPSDVNVISVVGGATVREHHSYSNYRLFGAQSRMSNPKDLPPGHLLTAVTCTCFAGFLAWKGHGSPCIALVPGRSSG
jgi:hypothetical protein